VSRNPFPSPLVCFHFSLESPIPRHHKAQYFPLLFYKSSSSHLYLWFYSIIWNVAV
ncbi:hypothetical protein C0J52_19449, partial [Blattella germanica]